MLTASFWTGLVPFATVVSGAAAALALAVGAISLVLIVRQTATGVQTALLTTAFDAHKEYIKLCMEYPQLSSSSMMLRHLERRSFKGILADLHPENERALWFLSYVLFVMEQLALSTSSRGVIDPAWKSTIVDQLSYHQALLAEVWPRWKKHYSFFMDTLVLEALTPLASDTNSSA